MLIFNINIHSCSLNYGVELWSNYLLFIYYYCIVLKYRNILFFPQTDATLVTEASRVDSKNNTHVIINLNHPSMKLNANRFVFASYHFCC